ncbi:MAG TPA: ECF transporter S component [Candidatus Limnocylindrales bacterium]|jgi:energy-coupling factor transport system substrate-specific component|nr:ECF transporter S component [Candidatus Limnocylindrales bacterium]
MTTLNPAQAGQATSPFAAWRTRDILLAAIIGVVFGVVFAIWNGIYGGLDSLTKPLADSLYGMWLVPAILAPLLIRKPGAAIFAEMVAAGLSAFLGSQWGPDTLLSGFVQGAAAELVFAMTGYQRWSLPVLSVAAIASALGAFVHDWAIYYSDVATDVQLLRLGLMAVSAVVFAAFGSVAIQRSLDRSGVLRDRAI